MGFIRGMSQFCSEAKAPTALVAEAGRRAANGAGYFRERKVSLVVQAICRYAGEMGSRPSCTRGEAHPFFVTNVVAFAAQGLNL